MPPKVYECVDVGGWSQEEIVPPLIVANVQAAVLVHPVGKPHNMDDRGPKRCNFNESYTSSAKRFPFKIYNIHDHLERT